MAKISLFDNKNYTLSDNELLQKIYAGEIAAFEVVYEKYSKHLYNYVLSLLNFNTEEAGFVISDVFIKVYEYLQNKKIDNLKSFLFKIAHNTSIDRIRKNQNQQEGLPKEVDLYVDVEDKVKKQNLDTQYKKKLLKEYLGKLDEKYRSVIYLLYYEDKSYEEIAEIHQSNKNTVGTLALQGKKRLEDMIKKSGLDPNIFLL